MGNRTTTPTAMAESLRLSREETRSSQATLIEVDPSPVDETPAEYGEDGSYFPDNDGEKEKDDTPGTPYLSRSGTLVGLGHHGPAFYLTRIQKYSSYAFTIFGTFHITNTSIIPLLTRSVSDSDSYLLLTRPYYQSLPFEPLLVTGAIGLHIASGLALRLFRRRQQVHRYGAENFAERRSIRWPAVSWTSMTGYALAPLVIGHAFVNRAVPLMWEGGSANVGLEYVSHGFAKHPIISFVGFTALVTVGSWHFVSGWAKWLNLLPTQLTKWSSDIQLRRKRRFYLVNGVAAAVAGLWLAGGLGVVGRGGESTGWLAKEYDFLYSKIPIVGSYL